MAKRFFRPYGGIRISSRGVRPYMGVGCIVPILVALLSGLLMVQL